MGKYHSNKHNHIYAGQNKVHAIKLQKVKFTNTISKDLHITHYSNIVIYKSMLISVGKNLHLHWNCCSDSGRIRSIILLLLLQSMLVHWAISYHVIARITQCDTILDR